MSDPVTAPSHYEGDGVITAKDAMRSMMHGAEVSPIAAYWWGCAFKYVWRAVRKNGLQDIDKAIQCLTELRSTISEEVHEVDPR